MISILRLLIFLFSTSGLWFALYSNAEAEPMIEGQVTKIEVMSQRINGGHLGVLWEKIIIDEPGTEFFRIKFGQIVVNNAGADADILILDRNNAVLEKFDLRSFQKKQLKWSKVYQGGFGAIQVRSNDAKNFTLSLNILEIGVQVVGGHVLNQQDPDNPKEKYLFEYSKDKRLQEIGRSVAKLSFPVKDKLATCTGFLVSENLLITNYHCVHDEAGCSGTVAIFNYEYDASKNLKKYEQYSCLNVVAPDDSLDYALLYLDGNPGAKDKWGHLEFDANHKILKGERLLLIQHPSGGPKMVAFDGCLASTENVIGTDSKPTSEFGHVCDTQNGSSGSPVLSTQYKVIGLHHLGFDSAGRWQRENRAVKAKSIKIKIAKYLN